MLRRREFGILASGFAGVFALTVPLAAQTTVKLQRNVGTNPLQAAVAELTVPSRCKAAQRVLWQAGKPAVPLLTAEIERGGAGEAAARFVLELLGCEAASAVPVLRRIVADQQTEPARRARVAATLAKIDGPPIILLSLYSEGAVVEFDLDGNERRRVAVESAWGAWPMPDDHVGVLSFSSGVVEGCAWDGKRTTLRQLKGSSGSVVLLDDGHYDGELFHTCWQQKGELVRLGADGKEAWKREVDAVRVERDSGDELFVVTRENPRVVWFSTEGVELRECALPEMCHNVQMLPGGGFLAASHSTKVYEFGPDGTQVHEWSVESTPNDVARLSDGRTIVSTERALIMFGPDGKELWSKPVGYGGPMFVRAPARVVK
ncbi:MAG: hypothetical protein H6835_16690 [Planctomycetes bacterium]|nr:hypothetical protein [Planctomycetota bacterium]